MFSTKFSDLTKNAFLTHCFQLRPSRAGRVERGRGGGEGRGVVSPSQSFLSMCPLFGRALEMSFLKEVTKNVHGNQFTIQVS